MRTNLDLYKKLEKLPQEKSDEIKQAISNTYSNRPNIAMVDSDKGITNLHASNDIIIDASLPPVIREGGKMWNKDGKLQECKAVIPDRCYATMYKEIIAQSQVWIYPNLIKFVRILLKFTKME